MQDRVSCRPLLTPSGQRACRALWIDRGLLQQDGPVAEVCAAYQRFAQFKRRNG
jgi:hypothetical protein